MLLAAKTAKSSSFVDINVPSWAWFALIGLLFVLLAVDLVRHRETKAPTQADALRESLGWVACGLSFSVIIWFAFGGAAFSEYLSGYVIEKSLSVDNVFVWSLVFTAMAIPLKFQHRVLFWGIFGALVLRAIFIFAGTALIAKFSWLLIVFGLFLVFTGLRILKEGSDDSDPEDGGGFQAWVLRWGRLRAGERERERVGVGSAALGLARAAGNWVERPRRAGPCSALFSSGSSLDCGAGSNEG